MRQLTTCRMPNFSTNNKNGEDTLFILIYTKHDYLALLAKWSDPWCAGDKQGSLGVLQDSVAGYTHDLTVKDEVQELGTSYTLDRCKGWTATESSLLVSESKECLSQNTERCIAISDRAGLSRRRGCGSSLLLSVFIPHKLSIHGYCIGEALGSGQPTIVTHRQKPRSLLVPVSEGLSSLSGRVGHRDGEAVAHPVV